MPQGSKLVVIADKMPLPLGTLVRVVEPLFHIRTDEVAVRPWLEPTARPRVMPRFCFAVVDLHPDE